MDNLDPGAVNYFDYKTNTTNCGDGTFCPNPGNITCCYDHQGVKQITFHNDATIPTVAAELSTYYEAANYSIPNPTSGSSPSTTSFSKNTFIAMTSTRTLATPLVSQRSSAQSTPTADSEPTLASESTPASRTSNSLSSGGKAGVAIAAGACASMIGVLLYLLRRTWKKRLTQPDFGTKGRWNGTLEMPGHDARTEMDAVEGRFPQELRSDGGRELMGQEGSHRRAEMPT